MVNWKELVGKRILFRKIHDSKIIEGKVVKVSPSGKYVNITYGLFNLYNEWYSVNDIILLEVID